MITIRKLFGRLLGDECGLTAVEYAVLGAIVVGAISSIGTAFSGGLTGAFQLMIDNFTS
ncbi:Flp family type IVb pilin [Novosphingobium sp. TCA1]|uniref:Flp family type IVb pilin n=1 Tax=Novosphingobium sp. TCA1 TaxID=2682474 RepID=UPI0013587256|nr:Flp family type IVb pilin [Novosphingobium sp. TCA1]